MSTYRRCPACEHIAHENEFEVVDFQPYTVILLYPDYMAHTYGQDTCTTSARATTAAQAVQLARAQICEHRSDIDDPTDLFVIAVIKGIHKNLNPGI